MLSSPSNGAFRVFPHFAHVARVYGRIMAAAMGAAWRSLLILPEIVPEIMPAVAAVAGLAGSIRYQHHASVTAPERRITGAKQRATASATGRGTTGKRRLWGKRSGACVGWRWLALVGVGCDVGVR
jgi:hypothetical protein